MDTIITEPSTELIEHMPFVSDDGLAGRARIGLVVLASDHTVEYEYRRVLDMPGVSFYGARIPNTPEITPENLAAMEAHISATARLILPGEELDVIAYGCTSASMVIGEEKVFARLAEGRPEAKPTTPITAAFAAFDAFNAKRIAVVTPYPRSVNVTVRDYIVGAGYEVPVFGSFNEDNDNVVARISAASLRDAILSVGRRDDVDMVFLSCTSLRLVDAAREIETALGKPVTASNHAMAWHSLRLAGIDDKKPEFGRLYEI